MANGCEFMLMSVFQSKRTEISQNIMRTVGELVCRSFTAVCNLGYTGTTSCTPCPQDTYKDTLGSAACTPCGPNSGTNGLTAQNSSAACGELCFHGWILCACFAEINCKNNTVVFVCSNVSVCIAGFTFNAGTSVCDMCGVDTFKPVSGNQACTPCDPNSGTNGLTGQTSSSACGE